MCEKDALLSVWASRTGQRVRRSGPEPQDEHTSVRLSGRLSLLSVSEWKSLDASWDPTADHHSDTSPQNT